MRVIQLLAVLLFLFSCADQKMEAKGKGVYSPKSDEALEKKHPDPVPPAPERSPHEPGEILVQFKDSINKETLSVIQDAAPVQVIRRVGPSNLYLMKITDGTPVEQVVRRLQQYPDVVFAEPNYIRSKP